ncbi:MAG: hypothetical protein RLZZ297_1253 [Chloroflexota bacterium]|jgi:release factor glutamine methyltransferase
MPDTTVRTVLVSATARLTSTSPTPRLDAELLLCHTTGWNRAQLIARATDPLEPETVVAYESRVARRSTGESVAYICGEREFYGLQFAVDARVLVPRPETELLVECARAAAAVLQPKVIVDIGTGSGCIAVALAHTAAAPLVVGVDISPAALAVAQHNVAAHGLTERVSLVCADLCTPLAPVSLIVSNPPYVVPGNADADVAAHEPALALYGSDADGASVYRRLAQLLPEHLAVPGFFACEIDPRQADTVVALLQAAFPAGRVGVSADLAGHARVVSLWLDG